MLFRDVSAQNAHARALNAGKRMCFRETFLPDSTAVLHIRQEQKAIFLPGHCLPEVVQATNEMTLSMYVVTDVKMIIKGDDG